MSIFCVRLHHLYELAGFAYLHGYPVSRYGDNIIKTDIAAVDNHGGFAAFFFIISPFLLYSLAHARLVCAVRHFFIHYFFQHLEHFIILRFFLVKFIPGVIIKRLQFFRVSVILG